MPSGVVAICDDLHFNRVILSRMMHQVQRLSRADRPVSNTPVANRHGLYSLTLTILRSWASPTCCALRAAASYCRAGCALFSCC